VRRALYGRALHFSCGCEIGERSRLRVFRFGGHVSVARLDGHFLC